MLATVLGGLPIQSLVAAGPDQIHQVFLPGVDKTPVNFQITLTSSLVRPCSKGCPYPSHYSAEWRVQSIDTHDVTFAVRLYQSGVLTAEVRVPASIPNVGGLSVLEGYQFPLGTLVDASVLSHSVSVIDFKFGPSPDYVALAGTTRCGAFGSGNGWLTTFTNTTPITITMDTYFWNLDARTVYPANLALPPGISGTVGVWSYLDTSNGCRSTDDLPPPYAVGYGRLHP